MNAQPAHDEHVLTHEEVVYGRSDVIHRGRTGTFALLIFATACGGGATPTPTLTESSDPTESPLTGDTSTSPATTNEPDSPFTELDGSIIAIIPATDIGDDGQPVDPGFTFTPDTPQITIVVQVGAITGSGSPINLTWFQATGEEETRLFTHTVEVSNLEAAYSVGTNPGTLAPGIYRVEAALEGESRSTQFQVEAPATAAAIASIAGTRGARGDLVGQGDSSGPPISGDSGPVETGVSDPSEGDAPYARWVLLYEGVDPNAAGIELQFRAGMASGGATVEVQATMAGNTRTLNYPLTSEQSEVLGSLIFNPCAHPGGSDLPGTEADFSVAVVEPGDVIQAGGPAATTLGPDESKPVVTINSDPPNQSKVDVGDEIVLDASAMENRDGPTWQEGLNSFQLIANPGGPLGPEERSAAGSAQPCDSKQWSLDYHATYTVPDDAPAIISICGEALDFAGNFSDPDSCNQYYTGEVWEGAVTGHTDQPTCEPPTTPVTGWMTLVVADDGTITGTDTEGRASFSCGGTEAPGYEQTFQVTGHKTDTALELLVEGVEMTLPITGTHATLTVTTPRAGGFGSEVTYTVDCVTCPPL